jgi:hypothetical protein
VAVGFAAHRAGQQFFAMFFAEEQAAAMTLQGALRTHMFSTDITGL